MGCRRGFRPVMPPSGAAGTLDNRQTRQLWLSSTEEPLGCLEFHCRLWIALPVTTGPQSSTLSPEPRGRRGSPIAFERQRSSRRSRDRQHCFPRSAPAHNASNSFGQNRHQAVSFVIAGLVAISDWTSVCLLDGSGGRDGTVKWTVRIGRAELVAAVMTRSRCWFFRHRAAPATKPDAAGSAANRLASGTQDDRWTWQALPVPRDGRYGIAGRWATAVHESKNSRHYRNPPQRKAIPALQCGSPTEARPLPRTTTRRGQIQT